MILPIYLDPQPILRQKTQEVNVEEIKSEKFQQLIKDMIETMRNAEGFGLAGPQVGLNKRFTVINLKEIGNRIDRSNKSNNILILINPKITRKSFKKAMMEEGCLSIPGIYGKVKRPANITVKYLDCKGQKLKLKASGLLAFVVQHEIDHLDGVLFIDKVRKYTNTKRVKPDYPHA